MGWLVLTDDELALLRYTCDLYFTVESPVYYVEQSAREPADFAATYQALVDKKVIDPKTFRLTDKALNRLAPVSECDARIVMTHECPGVEAEISDFYLLDEIAVAYSHQEDGHRLGTDRDHDETIADLSHYFAPRRSSGDFVEVELSSVEYLVYALLAQDVRSANNESVSEDRMSLGEIMSALEDLDLGDDLESSSPPAPLHPHDVRGRTSIEPLFASSPGDDTTVARPGTRTSLPTDENWEQTLRVLESKGVLFRDRRGQPELKPAFKELARGLAENGRYSFIRYDFLDDEWLLRETSFLPVDGGLFFLGPTPEGNIAIRELDAQRLDLAMRAAVGPLPPGNDVARKKARDFLLRA